MIKNEKDQTVLTQLLPGNLLNLFFFIIFFILTTLSQLPPLAYKLDRSNPFLSYLVRALLSVVLQAP